MLERARKRKAVTLPYIIQAAWDAPLLQIQEPYPNLKSNLVVTRGDVGLLLVAVAIHANGFAIGLCIGKMTAGPLRELLRPPVPVQIILMPLWPVLWAIILDEIIQ
jgi:hypothetical protein